MKWGTLLLLSLASACGGGGGDRDRVTEGSARARGALVAKVNGAAIGVDQVRELTEKTELRPREALQRLEDELLLATEAVRRGYGSTELTEREVKRALVQALLADTVEKWRAGDLSAAEVRERFDSVAKRSGLAAESFSEHEAAVREQLLLEKRKEELKKLTQSLHDQIGVKLSEPDLEKLLSDPKLWGESS